MNLLAHAYLSFNDPEVLIGNMISDFVKGKKKFDYSPSVQKGIALHRAIDIYTDAHAATKHAATFLKPTAGRYAGAFVDVVYDHFLANDVDQFKSEEVLETFANGIYIVLNNYISILPEKFALMLPYMQKQNWLSNYKYIWGIQNSFAGLARRAKYLNSSPETFILFEKNYSSLQECYNDFFAGLKVFAYAKWKEIQL